MTVVYTLGKGSTWQNNELRYSIRSFVKYTAVNRIIIVGYLPDWIQNVEYIPFADGPRKQLNIHLKTLAACQVAPEFVQAADDHFILQPTKFSSFCYSGLLKDKKFNGNYAVACANTLKVVGPKARFYNLHIPMRMQADYYESAVGLQDWTSKEYLIKSLYANKIPGNDTELPGDVKLVNFIRRAAIDKYVENKSFLSVSDGGLSTDMRRWLAEKYPDKSIYER